MSKLTDAVVATWLHGLEHAGVSADSLVLLHAQHSLRMEKPEQSSIPIKTRWPDPNLCNALRVEVGFRLMSSVPRYQNRERDERAGFLLFVSGGKRTSGTSGLFGISKDPGTRIIESMPRVSR